MERVLMRIAVASEGLEVAPRFRQCASYMCYRVDRGIIVECQNLPNPGLAAPKLVALLVEMGVDTLIVGAIDYDVANVFCHAGIEVIAGAHGSAREVVQAYLTRTLTGVDELCHLDGSSDLHFLYQSIHCPVRLPGPPDPARRRCRRRCGRSAAPDR